jgi:hypothetical protein
MRMQTLHGQFKAIVRRERVLWTGTLQPSPLSDTYRVRIEYGPRTPPKVWVLSPALTGRPEQPTIPHTYPGPRPCLYLPDSGEWSREQFVAETIVPWTVLWLYFYEVWHVTGQWLGGGVHPKPPSLAE